MLVNLKKEIEAFCVMRTMFVFQEGILVMHLITVHNQL